MPRFTLRANGNPLAANSIFCVAPRHQHRIDVGNGPVGHFLRQFHDDALFNFGMQILPKLAQRPWRRDDDQSLIIMCKCPHPQLIGKIGGKAVFFVLVIILITAASGRAGLSLTIGKVRTVLAELNLKFRLSALAMIAQKHHLFAVCDEQQCVMRD